MIYGYARKTVSNEGLLNQIKKLEEFMVDEIHIETISKSKDIPVFKRLLVGAEEGSVICVLNYNKITRDKEFLDEIIRAAKEHYIQIVEIMPLPE